jgi:hypothetical protein
MALSAGTISLAVLPDTKEFGANLKSGLLGKTAGVGEGMGSAILGGLKSMAGPIMAVTAAFGIEKLVEGSVKAFESLAGTTRGMQRIIGGTSEEVSGLAGAMKLSGVSADNVTGTLTIFSKKLAAAAGDAKTSASMTAALGTSFKDAHGNLLPMSDLLPAVADRFKDMPNGIEKTALATQLFGRSGTQMIPFLNKGSEGIGELTAKAKDMGLVLDDASMNSFAESKKAQREFDATMQGLSVTIGSALLPVIEAFQTFVRDILSPVIKGATGFVRDHKEEFAKLAEGIKSGLMPIVKVLGDFMRDVLAPALGAVFGWISDNLPTVATFTGVLGGLFVMFNSIRIATGLWSIAQGVLNAIMAINPFVLVAIAVAALVAAIVWVATKTTFFQDTWKAMSKFVVDVWNGVVGFLGDSMKTIGNAVATGITNVINFFKNMPGNILKALGDMGSFLYNAGRDVVQGLMNGISSLGGAIGNFFLNLLPSWIRNPFKAALGIHSPSTEFHGYGENIGQGLLNGVNSMQSPISDAMSAMGDNVSGSFDQIITTLAGKTTSIADLVAKRNQDLASLKSAGMSQADAMAGVNAANGGSLQSVLDAALGQATFTNAVTGMSTTMGGDLSTQGAQMSAADLLARGYTQTSGTTIVYNAAKNDSISSEQKLVDAVQRAKIMGAL